MRAFLALPVDEDARQAAARVRRELEALPRTAATRLRPSAEPDLHMTLKFFATLDEARVEALRAAIAPLAARPLPPAPLVGLGAFPSAARPRVLFAEVSEGREALVSLMAACDDACAALGCPREERPPHPHLTLARIEGAGSGGALGALIARHAALACGAVDVRRLLLFESRPGSGASRYLPRWELPIGAVL